MFITEYYKLLRFVFVYLIFIFKLSNFSFNHFYNLKQPISIIKKRLNVTDQKRVNNMGELSISRSHSDAFSVAPPVPSSNKGKKMSQEMHNVTNVYLKIRETKEISL